MTRRQQVVLAVVRAEPRTTDDLYERTGYATLVQVGLIDYRQFRAVLAELERQELVASSVGDDGATRWRRT